jgi:hypothetical protein
LESDSRWSLVSAQLDQELAALGSYLGDPSCEAFANTVCRKDSLLAKLNFFLKSGDLSKVAGNKESQEILEQSEVQGVES